MKIDRIKKIGIAGSGIMGSGIAQLFARKGYTVIVTDIKEEFLENSKKLIATFNSSLIEEGLMEGFEVENTIKNIRYYTDKKGFSDCDVIIEAIIERMDIKQEFWQEVEEITRGDAIFATNTSGLSINEISKNINNKERFIGMHFWNPPHIIPLVELIKGDQTNDNTVNLSQDLLKRIDKESVIVKKDAAGFIGNRIQFAVLREALNIVEQDIATIEDVDRAMKYGPGFRYPIIGPLETADLGGLDTFYYISSYLFENLSDAKEPQEILRDLMENGNLGVKSKKGFYDYSDGKDMEAIKQRDKMLLKMLKHFNGA